MILSYHNTDIQLSDHFHSKEFECSCCRCLVLDSRLIDALEELRSLINRPIIVTSGFRCHAHNKAISGAKWSYHCKGMAADIKVKGMSSEELIGRAVEIQALKGMVIYDTFIHVDVRNYHVLWDGRLVYKE